MAIKRISGGGGQGRRPGEPVRGVHFHGEHSGPRPRAAELKGSQPAPKDLSPQTAAQVDEIMASSTVAHEQRRRERQDANEASEQAQRAACLAAYPGDAEVPAFCSRRHDAPALELWELALTLIVKERLDSGDQLTDDLKVSVVRLMRRLEALSG